MRIAFIASGCVPFHRRSLDERPLGGTETAVIRLADALRARGHEVFVVTAHPNPPLSDPLYLPLRSVNDLPALDLLIAVRDWQATLVPVNARLKVLWSGDAYDQPATFGMGDRRVIAAIDFFFAVSHWHAETMAQTAGFPLEKIFVLRNGIHPELFQDRSIPKERRRLIYSSTPYRGLQHVPVLYRRVREIVPDTSLHIFSAFDVYQGSQPTPEAEQKSYELLVGELRSLPGCVVHGNILQRELAREFLKSAVLFYPNTFAETSCITAMEAQAAGCVPLTSRRGGLTETVNSGGILISGEPGTVEYDDKFVEIAVKLLTDDQMFQTLARSGIMQSASFSWAERAKELESLVTTITAAT